MKKYINKVLIVMLLSAAAVSCEDMIDAEPRDILVPDLGLPLLSTYQGLINSAYDRMQSFNYLGQQFVLQPDALADNLVIVNQTGRYQAETTNNIGAHMSLWFLYPVINDVNIVIDSVYSAETGTEEEKDYLAAQARFIRGMVLFDMLRVHAYEPNEYVDDFTAGVILRDEPVYSTADADFRPRASVEESYEFIETDLLEAADLFAGVATTSITRANLGITYGMLARLYLYWEKWDEAIAYANLAKANTTATLVTAANYVASFTANPNPESLMELAIIDNGSHNRDWNTVDYLNESLHSMTTSDISGYQFVVAGSQDLIDSYETGDVRRQLFEEVEVRGNMFWQNQKWQGSNGYGSDNIPIMRYSELLLIEAEANYFNTDEQEARDALTALRTSRGLAAVPNTVTGNALFNLILNENRVEFAFEGHRWFDFKRNGLDIPKANGPALPYTNFRVLAQIPITQVVLNDQLIQNPGY